MGMPARAVVSQVSSSADYFNYGAVIFSLRFTIR